MNRKNSKIFSGIIKALFVMLILLVWQENSYSQTTWTGAVDDKWQDAGNWGSGLPAATISAFINNNDAVVLDSGVASAQSLIVSGSSMLTVSNGVILSANRSSVGGGPLSTDSFLTINGTGSLVTISFPSSALLIGKGSTAIDTTGTVTVENGGELRLLNGLTGYVSLGGDNAINPTTGVSTGKLILNGTAGSRGVMQFRQTRTSDDFGIIEFDGGILRAAGSEADFFQVDAPGTLTVTLKSGGGFIDTNGFDIGIDESITGTGALTKQGLGTLTLSASSSYLGGTTVQAGTLSLAHNNAVGSGAITTTGASIIDYATGVTIANPIVLNSSGTQVQVNSGSATQSGVISETGGARALEKIGAGALVLSGNNTYSGGTTLSQGALVVGNNNALGSGTLTIENGTTLSQTTGTKTLANNIVINGDFTRAAAIGDVLVLSGNIELGSATRMISNNDWTLLLNGSISGTGGLTLNAGNTVSMGGSSSNTYTGLTTVNGVNGLSLSKSSGATAIAGNLRINSGSWVSQSGDDQIADTSTVTINGTYRLDGASEAFQTLMGSGSVEGFQNSGNETFAVGSGNFSGTIKDAGSNDTTLRKFGIGTLTLSGTNTYRGGTQLDGGILSISANNNLGNSSSSLIFNGATLQNTAAFSTARVTTLNVGGGTFQTDADLTHSGIISGAGSLTKTGASTLTLSGSNTYSGGTQLNDGILSVGADNNLGNLSSGLTFNGGTLQNTATFSTARATTINAGGGTFLTGANLTHSGVISGAGSLAKTGASTFTLSGSNTYSGGTQLNDGILSVSADNNLGNSSSGLTFDGGTLQNTATFFTARVTTLNAAGGTFLTGANLTHNGVISGAGGLTKTGASTLTLSGSNTYSGGTQLNDGILSVSADNNLGNSSGGLTFNGGTLRNTMAFSTARATTLNANGIFQTGADLTHSGVISGAGSLTKIGASSLLLSGSNTYSGGTIINSGTLRTTSLTALGSGPVIHNAGILDPVGTLNTGDFTWNGGTIATDIGTTTDFIDAAGSLTLGASGEFDFTEAAGFSNNTFYKIFNADNLGNFDPAADFFGNVLSGLAPVFSITGNDLFVNFLGTPFFTGAILQNSAPVGIPTFSDFIVNGAVTTGAPTENNIINGLIFNPSSSLRVFNTLTVTSGRFTVNAGTGTISGGKIVVPGDFNKEGAGKLILNDSVSVAGAANVKAGALFVNGTFTTGGGLTVFQNALLGGSGIINGNVVNNGTVNPGNSPGTLIINGNYTQSSSGTLQIEIASPSVFDRLIVSGNAALAGTLQAINYSGNDLYYGQQLDFLQAGSISGDFDRILMPDPKQLRGRFLVENGSGTLLIAPTSYTLVAETANQRKVARALDSYISERGNDRETISIALDIQSEGQYAAAFDAITPTLYENLVDIGIEQAVSHNQMLVQRMSAIRLGSRGFSSIGIQANPLRYDRDGKDVREDDSGPISATHAPRWSTWVQASGIFAKLSNASQMPARNFQTGGVLIGADHTFGESDDLSYRTQDPKLTVGGYVGYDYTWIDNAVDSNSRISSVLFGAYATYENGGFYADTILGGGSNDYQMRRSIDFSTVDRTARSSPDGGQFNAYQDLGYDWRVDGFTIGVLAGSQYTYVGISSFSEDGAQSLDLRLDRQAVNSIRTNLGGRIAYAWDVGPNLIIIPELRAFWQHEFLEGSREIGAALDGGSGSSFAYDTEALGQDSILAGAGVSANFGRDWSAYVYYNANFARKDYLSHTVSTGLEWRF